jgi:hypothetical protein
MTYGVRKPPASIAQVAFLLPKDSKSAILYPAAKEGHIVTEEKAHVATTDHQNH